MNTGVCRGTSADHWLRNSTHPNTTKLSCASKGRSCPHYQHQGWYPCGEQWSRTALGILLQDSTTLYSSIRSFSCWWKTGKHYWKSHEEMFSLYLTFSPAGPHTLPIPMNKESAHRWGSGLAAFCFRPPKRMALHNLLQKLFTGCTKWLGKQRRVQGWIPQLQSAVSLEVIAATPGPHVKSKSLPWRSQGRSV